MGSATSTSEEISPTLLSTWRDYTTLELLRAEDHYGWYLAELPPRQHINYPTESAEYVRFQLTSVRIELDRRARLRDRPEAPAWPNPVDQRAELDRIKAQLSIVDFLDRYTIADFRRSGHRLVTRCMLPGHDDDDSPSFTVYPADGGWYCFGCHRGGDVFTLAQIYLAIDDFPALVDLLAGLAGVVRQQRSALTIGGHRARAKRPGFKSFDLRGGQAVPR